MLKFLKFSEASWVTNRGQMIRSYYRHRLGLPTGAAGAARIETPYGSSLSVPLPDQDAFLQVCGTFTSDNPWNKLTPDHEPKTIVDLGSNRGYTALYWKARFPNAKVFCVEMDSDNAHACTELFEHNQYSSAVSQVAIAETDGSVTYRSHDEDMRHRLDDLVQRDNQFVYEDESTTVPSMTLSSYLDSINLDTVDLMKVDIEGAEQYLLDSASDWAERVSLMAIEIHHNIDKEAAKRTLEQVGFDVEIGDEGNRAEWWCRRR